MISLPSGTRIWLVAGVTDMRKSFNGLGEQVQHVLNDNPFSGHLFIFRGRRGDTVKILWADADGLCLFTKRLEEGQFIWPAVRDGKVSITRSQLVMLLDKLDWRQPKTSRLNSLTIGTCRLNSIDPEAYLRHILSVLPEWPSNRVDELLPWNVVLTNK